MKPAADYTAIYSDDNIVLLNKRSGLLIAADRYDPAAPRLDVAAQEEFGRLYAVHRIDRDTSGIVLYARTPEAHRALSAQFQNREVRKAYHCLVRGRPLWQDLTVDARLEPDGDKQHRTVVNQRSGKISITDFHAIGSCGPYCWLEACPRTGRTHQIRVHLQHVRLGIVCDPLYSGNQKPVYLSEFKRKWHGDEEAERPLLSRLALHAYSLEFVHPATGERVAFHAPYPRDLEAVRRQMAKLFKVDPLAERPAGGADAV